MANIGEIVRVSSVNCRGLQDKIKRTDVLTYIKNLETNIVCLQDTHWVDKDERNIRAIWNNDCFIHGTRTNSRGVAILLANNFEYKINDNFKDTTGNVLVLDLTIAQDFTLRLINIYAPNDDNPSFFDQIEDLIINNPNDYKMICGEIEAR